MLRCKLHSSLFHDVFFMCGVCNTRNKQSQITTQHLQSDKLQENVAPINWPAWSWGTSMVIYTCTGFSSDYGLYCAVTKLLPEHTLCRPFYNPCAAFRSLATVSIISYPTCARGIIVKWWRENDDIVNTDYCLLFS